jgi:hypothetical protein
LNAYFDASKQCYLGYQTTLSAPADNVNTEYYWSGLFLTCQDATAENYYVTLSPSDFIRFTYYSTANCNFQASWVITVEGEGDFTLSGDSFPGICGGVVYNVIGSHNINVMDTAVCGHILAPTSSVNQTGGVVIGKVVAGTIVSALQINKHTDCPNPGDVDIPTATETPTDEGQTVVYLHSLSSLQVGDEVTIGSGSPIAIVSLDSSNNQVVLATGITNDAPAGTHVSATVNGANGRPISAQTAASSSSASTIEVCVALLALIALIL